MTGNLAYRATLRVVVACGLIAAAVAHVPVTPEHLREAPYMGIAFVAFTVAALVLAGAVGCSDRGYLVSAGLSVAAVGAYVLTRLVAFPQLGDDVGNWTETLGLVSVAAETVVAIAAAAALHAAAVPARGRRRPWLRGRDRLGCDDCVRRRVALR